MVDAMSTSPHSESNPEASLHLDSATKIPAKPYRRTIPRSSLFVDVLQDSLAADIVNTSAFQRLRKISFLGAISHVRAADVDKAAMKENRYHHSLGVAAIAETFAFACDLPAGQRRGAIAAGLLHDIGHPPLSHSAESALATRFGDNHHSMTERLIRGKERLARDIPRILKSHGVDPENVVAILNGEIALGGVDLFRSKFNVDTLEGIARCSRYMSETVSASTPAPELVLYAVRHTDRSDMIAVLDSFWRAKGRAYSTLIRSPRGVIADRIANDYFLSYKGALDRSILLATESDLWRRHKKLYERLYTFVDHRNRRKRKLKFVKRTFVVNPDVPVHKLNDRYSHHQMPETYAY